MKVQGTYDFDAPLDTVWSALFDAEILARTLPGCEKLERAGNQFRGDINVKMGPVQGKFQGKVDITDIVERESYTMIVDGRGPAGFGKATASMRVTAQGTGTRLAYDSDVQVGGKIASVGQRLIDASSRAIVKQSLESLHEQIRALAPPPPAAEAMTAGGTEPARGAPPVAADGAPEPDVLQAGVPQAEAPAVAQPKVPGQPPVVRAPSQASFALGVAKEVTKELFPMRTVLLILGLLVLGWVLLRSLSGGTD
ncbi:MAG TPA: SRPBCC domain-containing protein [Polyangiaceae bacterium]|nr:SRPBCC domain-containing protein [Polyangiaceae bacterium]